MSAIGNNRNVNRQSNQDTEESDLEDSLTDIVEERLRNLLATDRNELRRAKNIFSDFQGDVPKLRSSVIARALQKVVCSTPMPTEKERDFFLSETSFNISPIDPVNEELEYIHNNNKHVTNIKNIEVGKEKIFERQAKVVLTPLPPVVIIDSSSEVEKEDIDDKQKDKGYSKNVATEKNICYNTRSQNKATKKNICYNTRSQNKANNTQQANATAQEQESSKPVKMNTTNDKLTSKITQKSNRKDSLNNRKRIDNNTVSITIKTPVCENIDNGKDQTDTQIRKDRSPTKSIRQNGEKNKTESIQNNLNKTKSPSQSRIEDGNKTIHSHYAMSLSQSGKGRNHNRPRRRNAKEENIEQLSNSTRSPVRNNGSQIVTQGYIKSSYSKKQGHILGDRVAEQMGQSTHSIKNNHSGCEVNLKLIDEINDRSQNQLKTKASNSSMNRFKSALNSLSSKSPASCKEITKERLTEQELLNSESREIITKSGDKKTKMNNSGILRSIHRKTRSTNSENNINEISKYNETFTADNNVDTAINDKENSKQMSHQENLLKRDLSHKEHGSKDVSGDHPRKMSARKLYFPQKEFDKEIIELDEPMQNQRHENAGRITKIPVLRSRSKSKEKLGEPDNKISKGKTREVDENLIKTPPKRPPRKKSEKRQGTNTSKLNSNTQITLNSDTYQEDVSKSIMKLQENSMSNSRVLQNNLPEQLENDLIHEKTLQDKSLSKLAFNGKNVRNTNVSNLEVNPESVAKIMNNKKIMIEAGTSPCSFSRNSSKKSGNDAQIDDENIEKMEKLNKLITKMSQKCFQSPSTPVTKNDSDKCLPRVNCSLHKENENTTQSEFERNSQKKPCRKMSREVQTSIRRPTRKISPIKSFARRIFTRTAIEQQTQTTSSVDKTYRRNKNMERRLLKAYNSDSSRNASITDQSEFLKEGEREDDMLFQSLREDFLPPSFSSSEDEVNHSADQKNLPWRLDDDVISVTRRSSYKLNFLRSAREIEMQRKSSINPLRTYSDTESEVEGCPEKTKQSNQQKQMAIPDYTRKNKVQVYSKSSQKRHQKDTSNLKSPSPDLLTDDERSSSSNSVVAPELPYLKSNAPHSELETENDENCRRVANKEDVENCNENDSLETTLTTKNLIAHNRNYGSNNSLEDRVADLVFGRSLISPLLQQTEINEEKGKKTSTRKKKNDNINHEQNKKSDVEDEAYDDNEILALPLEESDGLETNQEELLVRDITVLKSNSKEFDKRHNSEMNNTPVEQSNKIVASNKKPKNRSSKISSSKKSKVKEMSISSVTAPSEPEFKIPKARGRKSKKQIGSDNVDAVSSTTDSTEQSGVRRSGRERKPTRRRVIGVVETYSEKVLQYYNGTHDMQNPAKDVTIKSPKSSKKRKTNTKDKKTLNVNVKDKSEVKSNKRTKKKKPEQVKQQESEGVTDNLEMPTAANEHDDNATDAIFDNAGPISSDNGTPKANKKRSNNIISSRTGDLSNNKRQEEIPKKKNRKGNESTKSGKNTSDKSITDKISFTSEHHISCSTNLNNDHIPDEAVVNTNEIECGASTNEINVNCNKSSENVYPQSTESACEEDRNIDVYLNIDEHRDTSGNLEEHTKNNKFIDKDSGRSTMLKSTTLDDSYSRISKPLTGRIGKKYRRKKDNFCDKISKVLSRSINHSKELELLNGNEPNITDQDKLLRRSSLMQTKPTDGDCISLMYNNQVVSMKYVDNAVNYKIVRDGLMVTDSLKNNNATMGYLKLLPGCQKPLHIARKFCLFYFVIEGEGFIQVHNKTSRIGKLSKFVIPLGVEYSINNLSKEDPLVLSFVKMPPNVESTSVKTIV